MMEVDRPIGNLYRSEGKYRCNFTNLVQNLGQPPIKIWGQKTPNFGQFFTLPVHCSGTEQDIANLKTDY